MSVQSQGLKAEVQGVPLFQEFTEEEVEQVMPWCEDFVLPAQAYLFKSGEQGDYMYVLLEGKVGISQELKLPQVELGTKEKILTTLDGKDKPLIGEINFLACEAYGAAVFCITESRFLKISIEPLLHLCEKNPSFGLKVYKAIARLLALRLRRTNMDVVKLSLALSLAIKT